jgi:hypothetical protein
MVRSLLVTPGPVMLSRLLVVASGMRQMLGCFLVMKFNRRGMASV